MSLTKSLLNQWKRRRALREILEKYETIYNSSSPTRDLDLKDLALYFDMLEGWVDYPDKIPQLSQYMPSQDLVEDRVGSLGSVMRKVNCIKSKKYNNPLKFNKPIHLHKPVEDNKQLWK